MLFPHFEEYYEQVRALAGNEGPGRKLPQFDPEWMKVFMAGHELRKEMWKKNNEELAKRLQDAKPVRPRL